MGVRIVGEVLSTFMRVYSCDGSISKDNTANNVDYPEPRQNANGSCIPVANGSSPPPYRCWIYSHPFPKKIFFRNDSVKRILNSRVFHKS